MNAGTIILALWCLLVPAAFPATERSPHELFDAIKALRVDPSNVYHLAPTNRIELRRGDAVLSFEEGTLAFFFPLDGQITGAVFLGRGHVLAVPRDPVEKQQMGRFLGAPILDEEFSNAYLRFTDDTAGELLRQFHAADLVTQVSVSFAAQWESTLTQFNPSYTLRILLDRLSPNPKPCFYAALEGAATGLFDVVLDARREEQFLLGHLHKVSGVSYYDVWTAHRVPDSPVFPADFLALRYSLETSILPDNSLDGAAAVSTRAATTICTSFFPKLPRASGNSRFIFIIAATSSRTRETGCCLSVPGKAGTRVSGITLNSLLMTSSFAGPVACCSSPRARRSTNVKTAISGLAAGERRSPLRLRASTLANTLPPPSPPALFPLMSTPTVSSKNL